MLKDLKVGAQKKNVNNIGFIVINEIILWVVLNESNLDLLNEQKSNLKKSGQILKMVINKRKYTHVCRQFQSNGKVVSNGLEISNKFNRFLLMLGQL